MAAHFLDSSALIKGLSILTFVSSDGELNEAARAEGLVVEDPNTHP